MKETLFTMLLLRRVIFRIIDAKLPPVPRSRLQLHCFIDKYLFRCENKRDYARAYQRIYIGI